MTPGGRGRPLRFLALLLAGWIGGRVLWLWPQTGSLGEAVRQAVDVVPELPPRLGWLDAAPAAAAAATLPHEVRSAPATGSSFAFTVDTVATPATAPVLLAIGRPRGRATVDADQVMLALMGSIEFGEPQLVVGPVGPFVAPTASASQGWPAFEGSGWLALRGPVAGAAGVSRLGGSQAGARVRLPIAGRSLALAGGVDSPIEGQGAEARLGVEWQPGRAPVRLVADQRFGLDGQRAGPELGVVGGVGPVALGGAFNLEAYGQGGAIARARIEPYVDGAARVVRPAATLGRIQLSIGAGAWGAAQRDAARIDIGPSAVARVPIGDRAFRLSVDWRERVAGSAAPDSGPAMTLGIDL